MKRDESKAFLVLFLEVKHVEAIDFVQIGKINHFPLPKEKVFLNLKHLNIIFKYIIQTNNME